MCSDKECFGAEFCKKRCTSSRGTSVVHSKKPKARHYFCDNPLLRFFVIYF